jgi:hypothetical protein
MSSPRTNQPIINRLRGAPEDWGEEVASSSPDAPTKLRAVLFKAFSTVAPAADDVRRHLPIARE